MRNADEYARGLYDGDDERTVSFDGEKDGDGNYIKVNYTAPPDYIVIPKKADNVEGAKAFLTFMNSDEMLKLYTAETGSPRLFPTIWILWRIV